MCGVCVWLVLALGYLCVSVWLVCGSGLTQCVCVCVWLFVGLDYPMCLCLVILLVWVITVCGARYVAFSALMLLVG